MKKILKKFKKLDKKYRMMFYIISVLYLVSIVFISQGLLLLKNIETDIKKGKLVFEYIRNDSGHMAHKVTITLKITGANAAKWAYSSEIGEFRRDADDIAFDIADDLYYGIKYPTQDPKLQHSIAKTIKVTEFKVS